MDEGPSSSTASRRSTLPAPGTDRTQLCEHGWRWQAETGEFDYISDTYDVDLPYLDTGGRARSTDHTYTLDCNECGFATPAGL